MVIKQTLLLYSTIVHLGLLIFVFFRSRRSTTNLLFCLFLLVLTLWVASVFAISLGWKIPFIGKIAFGFGGMAGPAFLLFFLSFIKIPLRPWHAILGLPALVNFVGSLAGMVMSGFSEKIDFQPEYGTLFPFFSVTSLGYVLVILFLFIRTYLWSQDPFMRAQLRPPLLAALFTSIIALVGYLVVPLLMGVRGGGFGLLQIALVSVPLAFTYSIVRHRYMDITVALRGFFVFLIKVILLAFLITLSLRLLGLFEFPQFFLYFLLIALLISVAFFLPGGVLESLVDRTIFKTHYNYQRDIRLFVTELVGLPLMGLPEISQFLSAKLNDIMGVKSVELFFVEGTGFRRTPQIEAPSIPYDETFISLQKQFSEFLERYQVLVKEELKHAEPEKYKTISAVFEELGSDLLIPLRLRGSLFGFMSLGKKASGDLYSDEDIQFLITVGGQIAVAVDNARLYNDAIERHRELSEKEEALRESEKKFRVMAETTASSIFIHRGGKFVYVNPASEMITGYSREELLAMTYWEIVHPDFRELVIERAQARQIGEPIISRYEIKIITKQGVERWIDLTVGAIDYEGEPGVLGSSFDITERKQGEEALRKYERIVATTNDLMSLIGKDYVYQAVNEAYLNAHGKQYEDIINHSVADLMGQKTFEEKIKNNFDRCLTGEEIQYESWFDYPGWGRRYMHITYYPFFGPDQKVSGVVVNSRDITRAKQLEIQLQQVQKMEALGTLAGGIAHDFNNLLMGIQGRASLMLMDMDSSHPYFEHLRGIEEYIKSAADLTNQLLGIARGGKYEVKPTNLNEVVEQSAHLFARTKKEITIHSKFYSGLWTAEVDQKQIEQVLLNLYVNAWQAMPEGGELYLQTENVVLDEAYVKSHQMKPGKYVKISVTDTGVGMDEKTRQRVFDPFFTTKEMRRGTGLGLASAYGIIKNHGGAITVYSERGKGSSFNIYLPASEKEVVKGKKLPKDLLTGTETILLVDDEKIILDVSQPMLERLGYKVQLARSGVEAIDAYQKNKSRIDLVILDMIMPGMSGGETFDRLRDINLSLKVLLASGYSINGQAQNILDRGCNGFIQKPFSIDTLSKILREVLEKK